ncbi:hypothetical protein OVA24_06375 [Luteolibacter sp. SL250]|uniref:hypothetical protein n=1 Tax=Luteolibacter sp. SL250 TaxID=2995170 RepID=UPI002271413B|nr:hypothetical protein [Luteolibacter sp. SL250]WAC21007.1 hypothetical protein OVA24_06375 [Luteolibacter sp. SL250]
MKVIRCSNCGCIAGLGTPLLSREEIEAGVGLVLEHGTASPFKADVPALIKAAEDFAQPTAENLPPAKPVQPACMFMAALDHPVAGASCPRPLPGRPAPIPTVTSNGNPITL